MILRKKLCCVVTAAAMLLTMTACTHPPASPAGPADTTTTQPSTTTTTAPTLPPEEDPVPQGLRNLITGLYDMGDTTLTRPVGIMVANNDFIQDEQVGIGAADMWVESETEGGITRIMAVFANTDRVPASIGPVRSARSPFFHVVEALDLAYVHAGGSYPALNKIANSNIADMDVDGGDNGGKYSWRDSKTEYPHAYEYRLRTNGEYLTQYMADRNYKQYALSTFPWTFGEQQGETAEHIDIKMSYTQKIGFDYDSERGVYVKTNGSSETPHVDIDGNPIEAKSVILLYTTKFWETDATIDYYLQSGEGYVFSDGVMRRFDWTRDDSGFTMTEKDGTTLTLAEGKVYMCMISEDYENSLSYE